MGKIAASMVALFALGMSALAASEEVAAPVADGFDYPVGKPNGTGYFKARGFRPNGHLGEDWDGVGGGDTDFGDPVYAIGNGVVVLARNVRMGWGNVVLVRHAFFEFGRLVYIDALYGHVNDFLVKEGQVVKRGQAIATIGNNFGMYQAHLHFEVHKNLSIGVNHASCARDFSNYYDPTDFIESHRSVRGGPETTLIAMNVPLPAEAGSVGRTMVFGSGGRVTASVAAKPRKPFRVNDYRYSDIIEKEKEDLD